MIRRHTLTIGLSACFILSGCGDKIEEANQVPETAAVESPAPVQQPTANQSMIQHTDGELSVADLFAKKNELNGKVITLHGNVVKVSEGIMKKNWIHIQDGTGDAETNDIVFTSETQSANVGDHIIAKGTVATDKDFGYGYFYPVIVEEATFSK
ncbi:hypothetical protein [Sulfuricurvum sp.]|uniref:hypothetical protein n=1 Tax=Sulfuricurvum sp. TaxID=2025608 RepID=UPI002609CF02|nr:hypothetical protein [Sulfuricurvum sp.]MDD2780047.1 hypothetical protein [Sulfuricurvum sp.]